MNLLRHTLGLKRLRDHLLHLLIQIATHLYNTDSSEKTEYIGIDDTIL